MSTQTVRRPAQQDQFQELASELQDVHDEMADSLSALGSPLRELVEARVRASEPPLRAALVLSAGYDATHGDALRRIYLATALEMLHTALGIHQLLLDSAFAPSPTQPSDSQRSFIGSTILAGDFCFSRSAQLAAQTDNPTIVAIFARALQDVSERRLRDLLSAQVLESPDGTPDQANILMRSGVSAALELSDLSPQDRSLVVPVADAVIERGLAEPWDALLAELPILHRRRWLALRQWLDSE